MTISRSELDRLAALLERARRVHRASRGVRQSTMLQATTREDVLRALEDLAGALESNHLPVPPRMQQELRILRNLVVRRPPRSGHL